MYDKWTGWEVGERLFTFTKNNVFPIIHEDHRCWLKDWASSCGGCIVVLNKLDKTFFPLIVQLRLRFVHDGNLVWILFVFKGLVHHIELYCIIDLKQI